MQNSAKCELLRFRGVAVITLDFESSDPSSNLGGTYLQYARKILNLFTLHL